MDLLNNWLQPSVVQKGHSPIQWIHLYLLYNAIGFPNTYLLDGDLSGPSCSKAD